MRTAQTANMSSNCCIVKETIRVGRRVGGCVGELNSYLYFFVQLFIERDENDQCVAVDGGSLLRRQDGQHDS